jgi:hypothetical protein
MVLKIINQHKKDKARYRSSKRIITQKDIDEADKFDDKINITVRDIERILLDRDLLSKELHKKDPLQAWYIIGTQINKLLNNNKLAVEDESEFWKGLYGRSKIINKKIPSGEVSRSRNDFKTASLLAHYPFNYLKKIDSWALLREVITYKVVEDKRILEWIMQKLIQSPRTRDQARPLLKAVASRFKRMDTTFLNDKELLVKLKEIKL